MNKLIARIASRLGFQPIQKRNFAGASMSRLTNDWLSPITTADQEIRNSLGRLRARCRELERNSDYVRRFLSGLESNVLGSTGNGLQMKVTENGGRPDASNDLIEQAWKEWSKAANCSINGSSLGLIFSGWTSSQPHAMATASFGCCAIAMAFSFNCLKAIDLISGLMTRS